MITVENISVAYRQRGQSVVALENLSFTVADEEFLCILGPSGCGKSTALHVIGGFIPLTTGVVRHNGQMVRGPGKERGVVFQQHNLFPWKTVEENIGFGPRMRGETKQRRKEIVSDYIKIIGLMGFERSYPEELSVGMKQRVALARAFANDPEVLLMDEPFASLDSQTALTMRQLLLKIWSQRRKMVIFVTHDIDEAILLADRVLVLSSRPGKLKGEFRIQLPRPRTSECLVTPHYVDLKKTILSSCHSEVMG